MWFHLNFHQTNSTLAHTMKRMNLPTVYSNTTDRYVCAGAVEVVPAHWHSVFSTLMQIFTVHCIHVSIRIEGARIDQHRLSINERWMKWRRNLSRPQIWQFTCWINYEKCCNRDANKFRHIAEERSHPDEQMFVCQMAAGTSFEYQVTDAGTSHFVIFACGVVASHRIYRVPRRRTQRQFFNGVIL